VRYFDSERDFTRWVLAEARSRGWKAAHLETYTVVRRGPATMAVPSKHAAGFPDLFCAHETHGVFLAELKMPRGPRTTRPRELSVEQVEWIRTIRLAGLVVYVWLPHEQDEILDVLSGALPTGRLFDAEGAA